MSMYNMMFGRNPAAPALLTMLGLKESDMGRFRDAFVSEGKIAIYTRNGGGNREHWDSRGDEEEDCTCPGCTITYRLPKHPNYLYDEDDEYDCTYATVYFSIPEEFKMFAKILESGEFNPDKGWAQKLEEIKKASPEEIKEKYLGIVAILEDISKFSKET